MRGREPDPQTRTMSMSGSAGVQAIVVRGAVDESIHGRSAVDRHLSHLRSLGLRALVHTPDDSAGTAAPALSEEVLWIDGDTVFDARLYREAWRGAADARFVDGEPIGLAKLSADTALARLTVSEERGHAALRDVEVESVDPYIPEMRRRLRPYWVRLATTADVRLAEEHILDAAQKGNLDFPARFLHPFPENALATALAHGPLTPNHVTLISALIGFGATWLFWTGDYLAGFALAIVANILDGVDGKLARITLRQSVGGDRLDHALDIGFEFSWYLAFGASLSRVVSTTAPLQVGIGILATMVACRAVSGSYRWLSGMSIHDHRPFDQAFRLVAGRRNIFVLLLLGGFLAGQLWVAFQLVLVYAVATLVVYSVRNLMALAAHTR